MAFQICWVYTTRTPHGLMYLPNVISGLGVDVNQLLVEVILNDDTDESYEVSLSDDADQSFTRCQVKGHRKIDICN
jgi:hypothetical protein